MTLLFDGFYSASISTIHLLYIVTLGILTKKLKLIDNSFHRTLSKTVTNIILPSFIFAQIMLDFRIENYKLIFHALFGCCFLFVFGLIMGFIISKLLRLSKARTNFLAAVFSTPHTTTMLVILIPIIGPVLDAVCAKRPEFIVNAQKRGFLYIVMNSVFSNIWRWSGAYYLIEPEESYENDDYQLINSNENNTDIVKKEPKKNYKERDFKDFLKSIINSPLIASLVSLSFTLSTSFQSYFYTPGTVLNDTIVSVSVMISKSYGFIVMYILGISFADFIKIGDEDDDISKRNFLTSSDLFWLSLMKLIIMPLLACPLLVYFYRYFFQEDDVMLFVYLFMASAPSAINIIIICSYKKCYVETVSLLMIYMYAAAIITITLQVTFFIWLIAYLNGQNQAQPIPPV